MKSHGVIVVVAFLAGLAVGLIVGREPVVRLISDSRQETAKAQCERWVDRLDKQTTNAGVYVRWNGEELPDDDPWGRPLQVSYSQGGLAEHLEVRSLGPDGESHTKDDVVAGRQSVNLKGVGTGIREGAEETSAGAARGVVRGTVEGVKDALGLGKDEPKSDGK